MSLTFCICLDELVTWLHCSGLLMIFLSAPISCAIYSCNNVLVYAGFWASVMVQLECLMQKAWGLSVALLLLHIYHWEWAGKWDFSFCHGSYVYFLDLDFGKAYYDLIYCLVIYWAVMPILYPIVVASHPSELNQICSWNDRWKNSCYWVFTVRRKMGCWTSPR